MRIASFRTAAGPSYGIVVAGGVRPAPADVRSAFPTLRDVIAAEVLSELAGRSETIPFAGIEVLPPIPNPPKIICIGKNYASHAAESGDKPAAYPNVFLRSINSLVPHGAGLVRPFLSDKFDFEGELAVVIGRAGRHVAEPDALSYVAGYACFMDGSIRDYQFGHSLAAGKNFFRTGAFGPWLTTSDEIPDPAALAIKTRVNGREVQHGSLGDLIFSIPQLISYVSGFTELEPGDVIATGTPDGVGFARTPPLWLQVGDTVEVEITSCGTLQNNVVEENIFGIGVSP